MTNLVSAYQKKEINEFEHILKGKYIPAQRIKRTYYVLCSQSKINYGRSFYSSLY